MTRTFLLFLKSTLRFGERTFACIKTANAAAAAAPVQPTFTQRRERKENADKEGGQGCWGKTAEKRVHARLSPIAPESAQPLQNGVGGNERMAVGGGVCAAAG